MVSRLFRKQLRPNGLVGSNPMPSAMKFQRGRMFATSKTPGHRYWEAKIGGVIVFLSRYNSHIMWGKIPTGMWFE